MMLPAKEVGGDFYDFFLPGENTLCLIAADVTGKGVGAALFMAMAKIDHYDSRDTGDGPPAVTLEMANTMLCADNPADLFVTAFCAIIDTSNGLMRYACAGHIIFYK